DCVSHCWNGAHHPSEASYEASDHRWSWPCAGGAGWNRPTGSAGAEALRLRPPSSAPVLAHRGGGGSSHFWLGVQVALRRCHGSPGPCVGPFVLGTLMTPAFSAASPARHHRSGPDRGPQCPAVAGRLVVAAPWSPPAHVRPPR